MNVLEVERTFLVKYLPKDYKSYPVEEIIDIYFPVDTPYTALRLRKKGETYELTKKTPVSTSDFSHQIEQTINLNKFEFEQFSKLEGKKVRKFRYKFPLGSLTAEIDIFEDLLKGLVLVDIELPESLGATSFEIPDFCLIDVTQEDFIAGNNLAGKSYENIEEKLEKFDYKKIV